MASDDEAKVVSDGDEERARSCIQLAVDLVRLAANPQAKCVRSRVEAFASRANARACAHTERDCVLCVSREKY